MGQQAGSAPTTTAHRGLVLGELFVAIFLLAIAISSVTALMYSVTHHPRPEGEAACAEKGVAGSPKCVESSEAARATAVSASKLLLAGCATRSGARVKACKDSALLAQGNEATTLRSRTDSASLQLLPKKPTKSVKRPDLGFIR